MAVSRRTFVVHVYPEGAAVVEDVATGSREAVADLDRLGATIAAWVMAEPAPPVIDVRDQRSG